MKVKHNQGRYQVTNILKTVFLLIAMTGITNLVIADESVSVSFDKSLLNTTAGVEYVYKKLNISARRACFSPNSVLNDVHERKVCKREMLAEYISQISNPALSRYARSRTTGATGITVAAN